MRDSTLMARAYGEEKKETIKSLEPADMETEYVKYFPTE